MSNDKIALYPQYLEPLYSKEVKDLKKEYRELTGSFYHGFQVFDNPQISVSQYIVDLKNEVAKARENSQGRHGDGSSVKQKQKKISK